MPKLTAEQLAHDQLVYRFPKPQPDGRTELRLTPVELIERLAALIPPEAPAPPPLSRGAGTERATACAAHCLGAAANPALVRTAASWRSRPAPRALPGALALGAAVG